MQLSTSQSSWRPHAVRVGSWRDVYHHPSDCRIPPQGILPLCPVLPACSLIFLVGFFFLSLLGTWLGFFLRLRISVGLACVSSRSIHPWIHWASHSVARGQTIASKDAMALRRTASEEDVSTGAGMPIVITATDKIIFIDSHGGDIGFGNDIHLRPRVLRLVGCRSLRWCQGDGAAGTTSYSDGDRE